MGYPWEQWEEEREELDARAPGKRVIELLPIPDVDWGEWRPLYRVATPAQLEVATQIGRWWRAETFNDFPPQPTIASPTRVTLLIKATSVGTMAPLAGGAVEMHRGPDRWVLMWVWLFPFERSGHDRSWWTELETEFGDFAIQPPLSGAMKGFLRKVDPPGSRHLLGYP